MSTTNPATSRQTTITGKKASALTMVVGYEAPVYRASKYHDNFTYRGDQQAKHFRAKSELLALMLTLHTEITKNKVIEYAIYDNRPEAAPYPQNIILHKLNGVIMHDNTALYPKSVFELLNKFNAI